MKWSSSKQVKNIAQKQEENEEAGERALFRNDIGEEIR